MDPAGPVLTGLQSGGPVSSLEPTFKRLFIHLRERERVHLRVVLGGLREQETENPKETLH